MYPLVLIFVILNYILEKNRTEIQNNNFKSCSHI